MEKLPSIWNVLERISHELNLGDAGMADLLELTAADYARKHDSRSELSVRAAMRLSERLDLSFDGLVTGRIDFRALAKHFNEERAFLPERYGRAAFSRRRTSIYMLEFIESMYGWKERAHVLRRLQLNETIFSEPDEDINILFAEDVCEYISRYRGGRRDLFQMGLSSSRSVKGGKVLDLLGAASSIKGVYELICYVTERYFEENYCYQVTRAGPDGCEISGVPNPELLELLELDFAGGPAICEVRRGFTAAVPGYLGLPFASVRKTRCVHEGDPECLFQVDYSRARAAFDNRRRLQH